MRVDFLVVFDVINKLKPLTQTETQTDLIFKLKLKYTKHNLCRQYDK